MDSQNQSCLSCVLKQLFISLQKLYLFYGLLLRTKHSSSSVLFLYYSAFPTRPDICCFPVQDAYSEVASLFAEFFRDLDIVPSDIIAGLVLLRQRQRSKRSAILDQVSLSVKYVNVCIFVLVYTCAVMKITFLFCVSS